MESTPGTDLNRNILTEDQAVYRRSLLEGDVKYKIIYNFNEGVDYKGYVRVKFNMIEKTEIFLDYYGEFLLSIEINNIHISDPFEIRKMRKEGKIYINEKYLNIGKNVVSMFFENKYYMDYQGIHSYKDSRGNQYVFSQTVPYWGNRILPFFDQPDIKGTHKIHIIAPTKWTAITTGINLKSNEITSENQTKLISQKELYFVKDKHFWSFSPIDKSKQYEKSLHEFQITPTLPSYLHNFCLGEFNFQEFYDEELKLPVRIYYRDQYDKTMQVFAEKIYLMITGSVKFYQDFFDVKYPFEKYDWILIPDSKYGAMEFPAAVTCKESIVPLRDHCNNDFADIGRIVFHETAHMWFGNMVTMKWWSDLWLNESFAEYIAFVCYENLQENDLYKSFLQCDAWVKFVQLKEWGYRCDGLHTSHPIMNKIDDTEQAEQSFDGITYSKGASVMKQIVSLIGLDTFRKAIRNYMNIYKWKNADINELFECLQQAINFQEIRSTYINKHVKPEPLWAELGFNLSEEAQNEREISENYSQDCIEKNYSYDCIEGAFNLMKWKEDWIHTAGTNRIKCKYDVENELLKITQEPVSSQFPYLRFHKIKIAFYHVTGKVVDILDVIVQNKEQTVIKYSNPAVNQCTAILPNYDDLDFVKFDLDETSQMIFCNILSKIQSPVSKSQLFKYLEDLVLATSLPAGTFIDLVLDAIGYEDENVVDFCLSMVSRVTYSYSSQNLQQSFGEKAFMKVVMMYIERDEDLEFRNMCKSWMIHFANSENSLKTLVNGWLGSNELFEDCTQDFGGEELWNVIQKMVGSNFFSQELKIEIFEKYKKIDESDVAKSYIRKIQIMMCSDKEERIEKAKQQMNPSNPVGLTEQINEMDGFMHFTHGTEAQNYHAEYFFENILHTLRNTSHEHGEAVFNKLVPKTLNYTLLKCKKLKETVDKLTPQESFIKILFTNHIESAVRRIETIGIEALQNQVMTLENDSEEDTHNFYQNQLDKDDTMEQEKMLDIHPNLQNHNKSESDDEMLTENSNTL